MTELVLRILRHALDFQTQNLQLFHYPRHTVGYHTQIFATDEHRCTLSQHRELLHGFVIPELVVTLVVVMVVQTVECFLFAVAQAFEDEVVLNGDARMVSGRILAVGHEQDIANQRINAFAHVHALFVFLAGKPGFHLALGIVFRTHFPDIVMAVLQECFLHEICLFTEHAVKNILVDERTCHEILLEVQAEVLDFFYTHRQCRNELAEQTMYGMRRNFPDAEESEDVVDAVGGEVFGHLAEAFLPPQVVVLFHHVPIVGRESPVLSVGREGIGWCARLSVHVEVIRFNPGFHAVSADTDRNVPLEDDTLLTGVVTGFQQLDVQVVLDVIIVGDVFVTFAFRSAHGGDCLGIIFLVFRPLAEIRCAIQISEVREGSVREQPVFVVLEEFLEFGRCQYLLAGLLEHQADVFTLGVVHRFIVDLCQGIQFQTLFFESGGSFLVLHLAQLAQVDVHRVESVDGDTIIRIGVYPRVGDGSIVNRENLDGLLVCLFCPVHQLLQVAEVAHTEATFATEREYRDSGTCHLARHRAELYFHFLSQEDFTLA